MEREKKMEVGEASRRELSFQGTILALEVTLLLTSVCPPFSKNCKKWTITWQIQYLTLQRRDFCIQQRRQSWISVEKSSKFQTKTPQRILRTLPLTY